MSTGEPMSNGSIIEALTASLAGLIDSWQIKSSIAGIGVLYTSISGGDAFLLAAVYVLMVADIVFGLCEAIFLHSFSPYRLHRGVLKFLSYSIAIVLVMTISASINTSVGGNLHIQDFFMSYIIATEAISIIRHSVRLGLPVPQLLINMSHAAQERAEKMAQTVIGGQDDEKHHQDLDDRR